MRIAQINAVFGLMSTGRTSRETSEYLRANGHECLTFYGERPGVYDHVVYMGSTVSHKLHAMSSRIVGDAGIGSWSATRKLIQQLKEYNPNIVHLRNLHGNFIHIPMLLRYLAESDTPTVISLHDCFFFTGGCMHYTSNGCSEWQRQCSGCKYLRRGKDFTFGNPASKNLKRKQKLFQAIPRLAVCGVSKWTAQEAAKSTILKHAPINTYIYNWIDLDIFTPQGINCDKATRSSLGLTDSDTMVLGVASGWGHGKGLDDFFRLAQLLPQSKIVLVGQMPTNVNLPRNIISVGTTNNVQQLAALYSAADVFVHLSLEETFGKVTAEALACGTPAVVYDSTASPELVDYKTGRVIPPGNIEAVAESVTQLSIDKSCIADCRARAKALFNMDTNLRALLELYRQTIELRK